MSDAAGRAAQKRRTRAALLAAARRLAARGETPTAFHVAHLGGP